MWEEQRASLRLECLKLAQAAKKVVPAAHGASMQGFHPLPREEYGAAEDVVKRAQVYAAFVDNATQPAPAPVQRDCQNETETNPYARKHLVDDGDLASAIGTVQRHRPDLTGLIERLEKARAIG